MRRTLAIAIIVIVIAATLGAFVLIQLGNAMDHIVCQVWSKNGPDGESFEFKVNDFKEYETLNEGLLSDLDVVRVTTPNGIVFDLERDFQEKHEYSGEGGRRWVLYGPPGYGLPVSGVYIFDFVKNGEVIRSFDVRYTQDNIGYPSGLEVIVEGGDVGVSWTPPENAQKIRSYKVILTEVWPGYEQIAWLSFHEPGIGQAVLPNVPMVEGRVYMVNVAAFYDGGFSYSEDVYIFFWEDDKGE